MNAGEYDVDDVVNEEVREVVEEPVRFASLSEATVVYFNESGYWGEEVTAWGYGEI